jgi:hypothetical protein
MGMSLPAGRAWEGPRDRQADGDPHSIQGALFINSWLSTQWLIQLCSVCFLGLLYEETVLKGSRGQPTSLSNRCHLDFCVMMCSEKALNPGRT